MFLTGAQVALIAEAMFLSSPLKAALAAVCRNELRGGSSRDRWSSQAENIHEPCLLTSELVTRVLVLPTQALAAVKARCSQVIDEVAGTHERVTVTRNGSPVAVILAMEDYELLMETLEILSDPHAVAEIRQAQAQMDNGEAYDETQVRAGLAARGQ